MRNMYSIQINDIVWNFFDFSSKAGGNILNKNILHIHSHAELFFCMEGSIQLKFMNEKITLNRNDLCLVPSGIKHVKSYDALGNAVWGAIGLVCNIKGTPVKHKKGFDSDIISMLYGDNIVLFHNNTNLCSIGQKIISNKTIDTATLLEFVCSFYKKETSNLTEKTSVFKGKNKKDVDRLLILDQIINNEYMYNLSNKEIADRLSISTRQLSRFVLANFNESLHNLIIKQRLTCAITQLVETNSSIETICHSVGFSNKTSFYQKFKEEFGITPVQYRNNMNKT